MQPLRGDAWWLRQEPSQVSVAVCACQLGTRLSEQTTAPAARQAADSGAVQTAIDQATQRGVLFVASAGNDGVNTDTTPHYPSSLPDDIVLAVGASTRTDTLW